MRLTKPDPGVYTMMGYVTGYPARILLDDAASVNCISHSFMLKHQIQMSPVNYSILSAEGTQHPIVETQLGWESEQQSNPEIFGLRPFT